MAWNLKEAIQYYQTQGAPGDQNALIQLLREIQQENGGSIPAHFLNTIAGDYGIPRTLPEALIRRIPSLRLENIHTLQLCAGPNCGKSSTLAAYAEKIASNSGGKIRLTYNGCMRLCGKGPNLCWDGKLYHHATVDLLKTLTETVD